MRRWREEVGWRRGWRIGRRAWRRREEMEWRWFRRHVGNVVLSELWLKTAPNVKGRVGPLGRVDRLEPT